MILISGIPGDGSGTFTIWACQKLLDEYDDNCIILLDAYLSFCGFAGAELPEAVVLTYASWCPPLIDQVKKHLGSSRFFIVTDNSLSSDKSVIANAIYELSNWLYDNEGLYPNLLLSTIDKNKAATICAAYKEVIDSKGKRRLPFRIMEDPLHPKKQQMPPMDNDREEQRLAIREPGFLNGYTCPTCGKRRVRESRCECCGQLLSYDVYQFTDSHDISNCSNPSCGYNRPGESTPQVHPKLPWWKHMFHNKKRG